MCTPKLCEEKEDAPIRKVALKKLYANDIDRLMKQVLDGNADALEILYKSYYNQLCLLALRIVNSREAAEEIVNDVFNKLWTQKHGIRINSSYKSYLFVSVRNQSVDFLRKYKKERYTDDIQTVDYTLHNEQTPYDIVAFNELFQRIQHGIDRLPAQCKKIFKMSREDGLKYAEIAERLGLSVKTIETQMGRALRSLREYVYGKPVSSKSLF